MFEFTNDTRLLFEEFVPVARSLELGGVTRMNHNSSECSGSSKSLIVRRTVDGKLLAYCHRCGKKGIFSNDVERELPKRIKGKYLREVIQVEESATKIKLPKDTSYDWKDWPLRARLFVKRARIDETLARENFLGYSPKLRKVVIPLVDGFELKGYQLRKVYDDDPSPKYLQKRATKNFFSHSIKKDCKICCVVEDVLSGIRVGKYVSSFCLMGTNLTPPMINELMGYDKIIVFLDDDNSIVKQKQEQIRQELNLWVDKVEVIHSVKQPKELTDTDLRRLLLNWDEEIMI